MLELRIVQGRRHLPIFDLPARLGRREAAKEIGDTIEGLIAFMDDLGGDPDLEEEALEDAFVDHPARFADMVEDSEAGAYIEWMSLRGSQKRGPNMLAGHEDAEDDDPAEDDDSDRCAAGDDWIAGGSLSCGGLLYPGADQHGDEDDERSQQIPVWAMAANDD